MSKYLLILFISHDSILAEILYVSRLYVVPGEFRCEASLVSLGSDSLPFFDIAQRTQFALLSKIVRNDLDD